MTGRCRLPTATAGYRLSGRPRVGATRGSVSRVGARTGLRHRPLPSPSAKSVLVRGTRRRPHALSRTGSTQVRTFMSKTRRLPVLHLTDAVVLPGMVVPLELDEAAQAAVDAARSVLPPDNADSPRCCSRPGSPTAMRATASIATVEKVGRMPGGAPAAVLRAGQRAQDRLRCDRPGRGPVGRGRAVDDETAVSDRAKELAVEYKALVIGVLQHRDAWQVINTVERMTDPSTLADAAGWAPYLTDEQKRQLLETADLTARLELVTEWTRAAPGRGRGDREDPWRRPRRDGEEPARVPVAPAARRDPQRIG